MKHYFIYYSTTTSNYSDKIINDKPNKIQENTLDNTTKLNDTLNSKQNTSKELIKHQRRIAAIAIINQ